MCPYGGKFRLLIQMKIISLFCRYFFKEFLSYTD